LKAPSRILLPSTPCLSNPLRPLISSTAALNDLSLSAAKFPNSPLTRMSSSFFACSVLSFSDSSKDVRSAFCSQRRAISVAAAACTRALASCADLRTDSTNSQDSRMMVSKRAFIALNAFSTCKIAVVGLRRGKKKFVPLRILQRQ
jgi:hypothetical protein